MAPSKVEQGLDNPYYTYKRFQKNGTAAVGNRARCFQGVKSPLAAFSVSSLVGMNTTAVHVLSLWMSEREGELRPRVYS